MNKIISSCPLISMKFNPNLLSTPTFGYSAEYLYQISDFLQKKIDSAEFRKFPSTIEKLKQKQQQFRELYERAKTQEEQAKTKTCLKTQWLGYRPRLSNRNDQRIFERLDDRRKAFEYDCRKNNVSKSK